MRENCLRRGAYASSRPKMRLESGALKGTVGKRAVSLTYCGGTRFLAMDEAEPQRQRARLEFFIRDGQAWAVRNGSRIFGREEA